MASSTSTPFFSYSQPTLPIFDGEHYDYWSSQMQTFFISQDLWELVEGGYEDLPENPNEAQQKLHKENKKIDALALRYIHAAVSKTIFPCLYGLKKSKEAWDTLKQGFLGNEKVVAVRLQNLWRDFDNLEMQKTENIQVYFSRVTEIVNQIRSLGDTLEEKRVVRKVLRSMTEKYNSATFIIEESKDLSTLTMHELMGSLESHDQKLKRNANTDQLVDQAFQSQLNISNKQYQGESEKRGGNQRGHQYGRGRGTQNFSRGRGQSRGRGRGQYQNYQQRLNNSCRICGKSNHQECYFKCKRCRNSNHSQKDCWHQNGNNTNEANFTANAEGEQLFLTCMDPQNKSSNLWFLDSGCSNHMTGNKDMFIKLDMGVANQVTLGDGKKANVEGRGVIAVNSKANNTKYIHDVLYVPNLTHNLLSVGQLVQRGYSTTFDNGECIVTDKKSGTILAKVQMADNKVFPLHMPQKKLALQANVMDESYLWHLRYGHLNQKGLQLLKQKDMVVGLPHIDRNIQVCEGCKYGKMHHLPFSKTSWRAKAPLELVHADIFGPTRNPSLQNKSIS
uniref:Uncharacterized protein n=1 Tax=Chenopodium quinoa TaxID=63459 RepID=A0A803MEP4_CHEQI